MIDSLWVPPTVNIYSGMVVLLTTLVALVVTTVLAWRRREIGSGARAVLIVAQVTLMIQAVIGIKLLDQGLGPLQLFIHYLGGLGPLAFFFLYYWLPGPVRARRWTAVVITS